MSAQQAVTSEESRPGWARQGKFVLKLLKRHPILQPLRDCGESYEVSLREEAIRLFARPLSDQPGRYEFDVAIRDHAWYLPLKKSHGARLAQRLALRLYNQWADRAPSSHSSRQPTRGGAADE